MKTLLADLSVILLSNVVSCTYSEIPLTRLPSTHGNSVYIKGIVLMALGQIMVQYALLLEYFNSTVNQPF